MSLCGLGSGGLVLTKAGISDWMGYQVFKQEVRKGNSRMHDSDNVV